MIRIEQDAWDVMVSHARSAYPNECCGAMLGAIDGDRKVVRFAMRLENAFEGAKLGGSWMTGVAGSSGTVKSTTRTPPPASALTSCDRTLLAMAPLSLPDN